jgi:hypothetical protein
MIPRYINFKHASNNKPIAYNIKCIIVTGAWEECMNGILAGKTVVELGSMIAAPFATHILQQLGAKVIKIEQPGGETTRRLVRGGPSGTYIAYNRGKSSICLDLQSSEGADIFKSIILGADIVLHNLSPSAARKMNVTFERSSQASFFATSKAMVRGRNRKILHQTRLPKLQRA